MPVMRRPHAQKAWSPEDGQNGMSGKPVAQVNSGGARRLGYGQPDVHDATRVDLTEARSRQGAPQRGQGRLPHGQPQFGHAAITVTSLA
jgi:hypothetical protein